MNGRGCYCSSPFQRFYENPIQASNSQAYDPSPFQRSTGTFYRRANYSLPIYPGKYSQRLVILRAKRSLRSQALYFLYLSHPPETEKEGKRSYDRTKLPAGRRLLFPLLHAEATDDEELMFSGIWPTLDLNVSKQRLLTPTSN